MVRLKCRTNFAVMFSVQYLYVLGPIRTRKFILTRQILKSTFAAYHSADVIWIHHRILSKLAHVGKHWPVSGKMLLKWGTGKWKMGKNLTRTLALSVTSFPILCLVLIFHSPVPHVHSPIPVACFEYHPSHGSLDIVKKTNKQTKRTQQKH